MKSTKFFKIFLNTWEKFSLKNYNLQISFKIQIFSLFVKKNLEKF